MRIVKPPRTGNDELEEEHFTFGADIFHERGNQDGWSVDSGASSHMTGNKDLLSSFADEVPRKVTLADGKAIYACGTGTVVFRVQKANGINTLTANQVLYVPWMVDNLISVLKLTDSGIAVAFSGDSCTAYKGNFFFFFFWLERGWNLQTTC